MSYLELLQAIQELEDRVEQHLARVDSVEISRSAEKIRGVIHRAGSVAQSPAQSSPFGASLRPLEAMDLLYRVDRCEWRAGTANLKQARKPEEMLFSTISVALAQQVFKRALERKGAALSRPVSYAPGTLRENLYGRAPPWLAGIVSWILPHRKADDLSLSDRDHKRPPRAGAQAA